MKTNLIKSVLNKFLGNLLLGEKNLLDNREMQIKSIRTTQKTTQKILQILKEKPTITRTELAEIVGLSPDGVKWNLDKLKKANQIRRIGGDKGGSWEVLSE